jgi:hypothetical protein
MNERMRTVVAGEVVGWNIGPSYTPERVAELFGPRERLYMIDLLTLPIPEPDRAAMLFRTMSIKDLRLFVVWAARRVLDLLTPEESFSAAGVVDAAEAYAQGQIDESELIEIRDGWAGTLDPSQLDEPWYEIADLAAMIGSAGPYAAVASKSARLYADAYADRKVPAGPDGRESTAYERAKVVAWRDVIARLMDYCLKDRWSEPDIA